MKMRRSRLAETFAWPPPPGIEGHSVAVGGSMVVLDPPGSTIPPTEAPECSPTALDPTVFAWYIEPPALAEKTQPDESTRERLRALGYGAD
jgi:hypothetical protein